MDLYRVRYKFAENHTILHYECCALQQEQTDADWSREWISENFVFL